MKRQFTQFVSVNGNSAIFSLGYYVLARVYHVSIYIFLYICVYMYIMIHLCCYFILFYFTIALLLTAYAF